MVKIFNKLVRDKVPEIIRAGGSEPKTRVLDDNEYLQALVAKLKEEVAEFEAELRVYKNGAIGHKVSTRTGRAVEELADIKEVIIALREALGIHAGELEDARRKKAASNGRFRRRIFLESIKD